jgi:hypothetical protein
MYPQHGPHRKCLFHYCMFSRCQGKNMSTELSPSNCSFTVASLHNCYLAVGLRVTILTFSTKHFFMIRNASAGCLIDITKNVSLSNHLASQLIIQINYILYYWFSLIDNLFLYNVYNQSVFGNGDRDSCVACIYRALKLLYVVSRLLGVATYSSGKTGTSIPDITKNIPFRSSALCNYEYMVFA